VKNDELMNELGYAIIKTNADFDPKGNSNESVLKLNKLKRMKRKDKLSSSNHSGSEVSASFSKRKAGKAAATLRFTADHDLTIHQMTHDAHSESYRAKTVRQSSKMIPPSAVMTEEEKEVENMCNAQMVQQMNSIPDRHFRRPSLDETYYTNGHQDAERRETRGNKNVTRIASGSRWKLTARITKGGHSTKCDDRNTLEATLIEI
jgi:hypothetical protein